MATHFFGLTERAFSYSHSVGRNEFAGTGFRNPVDMAITDNNVVYVLNRGYEFRSDGLRISQATLDEEYINEFGSYGNGPGQMIWPTSLDLDSKGNLYVTDEWLNRINVFNPDGEFIRSWPNGFEAGTSAEGEAVRMIDFGANAAVPPGVSGSGDGELDRPGGIAISKDDIIFISDSRNHRIQKFTLDGEYLGQFGSFGSGHGQLNMPWGIDVDKEGNVFVADWRNDRIQMFTGDGEWLASFGQSGTGAGQFNRPNGVCVDDDGDIYVADWLNNRVQVLAPDGRFVTMLRGNHQLSQWGKDKLLSNPDMIRQRALAYSNDPSYEQEFNHPCGVRIDNQGRLAVLDHIGGRIQVYAKSKDPALV